MPVCIYTTVNADSGATVDDNDDADATADDDDDDDGDIMEQYLIPVIIQILSSRLSTIFWNK